MYSAKVIAKKFWGLHEIMNQYDYIILVDSETRFIKGCDFAELAASIWDSNSMFASNISYNCFFGLRRCFLTMGLYDNPKLMQEMENYRYSFWFNELQIYKCSCLPGFFEWLDSFPKEKYLNEWACFEYYIFFAYLFLEHDFHLTKYGQFVSLGGINECMNFFPPAKQRDILSTMNLHWTSSEDVTTDNVYLLFHLDRVRGQKTHGETYMKYRLFKYALERRIVLAVEAVHCGFLLEAAYMVLRTAKRTVKRIIRRG